MSDNTQQESTPAQVKRKVEIDDLYRYRLVLDPQVSPDGRSVAYTQTRLRKKKNDYASNIWIVGADGGEEPWKLTNSSSRDMSPRWSPDGTQLAFLSTRTGKAQIWTIRVRGGEATQLTKLKRGAGECEWSPDGQWLAFTAHVDSEYDKKWAEKYKKDKEDKEESKSEEGDPENRQPDAGGEEGMPPTPGSAGDWADDEEEEKEGEDKGEHAKVITRIHYRGDGQGLIERRTHLFVVPAKGGKPRQLTEGEWDVGAPRWSPDGAQLAFISNQEPDAELNAISDIFVTPISEGQAGEMRRVTAHDCSIHSFDWLPTGEGFALFAHSRTSEAAYATNTQVWTLMLDGEVKKLTEGFDRGVSSLVNSDLRSGTGPLRPHFSTDGSSILFFATNGGAVHIFAVPIEGGEVRQVVGGERQVLSFGVTPDGVVFAANSATHPNDVYWANIEGEDERNLTNVNRDVLGELELAEPQEFWVDRPDGTRVQGWLLLPHGYREGEKYPLVLQVHGGPHTAYGGAFMHEFQVMAARGYMVMYTNPRGSVGYGQTFADAILNDWGGVDYDDLMACVDYAVERGDVDEGRLGVAGGSYGGYMSAWMVGHTDRFKAAVASRLVSNLYSAWGSGDFTWMLWNWEFEGTPQERTALYLERSPVTYAPRINTPLLLTHAADDLRTSIEQADQMYTALKTLGKEAKMVRFPSGGHDISRSGKPTLRVERIEHIAQWFDEHLRDDAR